MLAVVRTSQPAKSLCAEEGSSQLVAHPTLLLAYTKRPHAAIKPTLAESSFNGLTFSVFPWRRSRSDERLGPDCKRLPNMMLYLSIVMSGSVMSRIGASVGVELLDSAAGKSPTFLGDIASMVEAVSSVSVREGKFVAGIERWMVLSWRSEAGFPTVTARPLVDVACGGDLGTTNSPWLHLRDSRMSGLYAGGDTLRSFSLPVSSLSEVFDSLTSSSWWLSARADLSTDCDS